MGGAMLDLVRVARARKALLDALASVPAGHDYARSAWSYNETDCLAERLLLRRAAWVEDGCMLSEEIRRL